MLTDNKLEKIQNSIVNNDKIDSCDFDNIRKLPKISREKINCYAFALGIMYPKFGLYVPGFTTQKEYIDVSREDFISLICEDLNNLEIKYRIFGINEKIDLKENEYLIQAMYIPKTKYYVEDFHFLRKSKAGFWYGKDGYLNRSPCVEDIQILNYEYDDGKSELVKVFSDNCNGRQYIRVAYFAIEEKT